LSEDPEIAKIMQKKLDAMINQKAQPKIEPGIIDLNNSNFEQTISADNPTLVIFGQSGVVLANQCIRYLKVLQKNTQM